MPIGLLTGLGAALAWGTMDIASALASRRIGSLRVVAGVQLVGATILVVVALLTSTALPSDPTALALSALLGLIGAGAYLAYFTGLRVGPIAVVSGVVAAYGGLTVVLSVVLRGETLTTLQAVGASIATIGVILTGIAFEGHWRSTRLAGPGVIFSIVALVLFAMMAITTDVAIGYADWLQVLLVSRVVNATLGLVVVGIVVWLAARRARAAAPGDEPRPAMVVPSRRVVATVVLAGMLDVAGLAVFAYGISTAPTWLVGLASSFGPAVTILIAVAFLGERLKPIQWFGLSGVAIGMIAIAVP
jgi:drug/metabolite transporter (DMT)-like permease